jgi:DNA-binding transcriptional LysR family regulator
MAIHRRGRAVDRDSSRHRSQLHQLEYFVAVAEEAKIAFEASDPVMLAELAARGLGVAILPRSLAEARRDQLHAVQITAPRLHSRIELAWRSAGPISPAARALINRARTKPSLL